MPGEWMWVIVQSRDDKKRIVYGTLDNEPVNEYGGKLRLGSELAVSYSTNSRAQEADRVHEAMNAACGHPSYVQS